MSSRAGIIVLTISGGAGPEIPQEKIAQNPCAKSSGRNRLRLYGRPRGARSTLAWFRLASLRAPQALISLMHAKPFLRAVRSEVVSPKAFLGIVVEQRSNIAGVKVRPPKLGTNGFGRIVVRYKHPILKPQHA